MIWTGFLYWQNMVGEVKFYCPVTVYALWQQISIPLIYCLFRHIVQIHFNFHLMFCITVIATAIILSLKRGRNIFCLSSCWEMWSSQNFSLVSQWIWCWNCYKYTLANNHHISFLSLFTHKRAWLYAHTHKTGAHTPHPVTCWIMRL